MIATEREHTGNSQRHSATAQTGPGVTLLANGFSLSYSSMTAARSCFSPSSEATRARASALHEFVHLLPERKRRVLAKCCPAGSIKLPIVAACFWWSVTRTNAHARQNEQRHEQDDFNRG